MNVVTSCTEQSFPWSDASNFSKHNSCSALYLRMIVLLMKEKSTNIFITGVMYT